MNVSKKILLVLIFCFIIIQLLVTSVDAATINMQLYSDNEKIQIDDVSTLEVELRLTNFDNIQENTVLGCYAEIDYDKNLLSLNSIEGQNGWNVEFNEETNKIVLDSDSASSNTTIAKMIFDIRTQEITKNENTIIALKDLVLTDGNFKINSELQIQIDILASKANKDDVQILHEVYTTSGEKVENNKLAALDETTLQDKILPYVGNGIAILIAIAILLVLGVIFKIKSRKIKY